MKFVIIILVFNILLIEAKQECEFALNLRKEIKKTERAPHYFHSACIKNFQEKTFDIIIIGAFIGFLLCPILFLFLREPEKDNNYLLWFLFLYAVFVFWGGSIGNLIGHHLYNPSRILSKKLESSVAATECLNFNQKIYNDVILDKHGFIVYKGFFKGYMPHGTGYIHYKGRKYQTINGLPLKCV